MCLKSRDVAAASWPRGGVTPNTYKWKNHSGPAKLSYQAINTLTINLVRRLLPAMTAFDFPKAQELLA